jgi:hypothetical protein
MVQGHCEVRLAVERGFSQRKVGNAVKLKGDYDMLLAERLQRLFDWAAKSREVMGEAHQCKRLGGRSVRVDWRRKRRLKVGNRL